MVKKWGYVNSREALWGFIFLSPWIIGFFMFTIFPMIASMGFSFTNYNLLRPGDVEFVGLDNYRWLFTDPIATHSAWITLRFAFLVVPLSILFPLFLAAILTSKWVWGKAVLRTLFFMPTIVPLVAGVLIWRGYLNTETGWLNKGIESLGINGPDWLNSTFWIYPSLLFVSLWGVGNAMTTLVAGMQGVPTELFEAAKVDGAGGFTIFRKITVPMITPVIFYNLILSVIAAGQYFLIPLVLQGVNGNPANSTMFFNLYLFKTAFNFNQMGQGAAMAWALFLVALSITGFLFYTAKYWVYYAAGDR